MITSTENPLLQFDTAPHYDRISADNVEQAIDAVVTEAEERIRHLAGNEATWSGLCQVIAACEENIERVWNQVEHMHATMHSPAWQAAYEKALPRIVNFFVSLGQNTTLYETLHALKNSASFAALSPTRQRIVDKGIVTFQLSGVGLPAAEKKTFLHNSETLEALSTAFEKNVLLATQNFSLAAEEADLEDMPADLRDSARQPDNTYQFTLQPPSYAAFMKYAASSAKRQALYRAYHTRASEFGDYDNTAIISQIVTTRHKQAQLLGFNTFAEMVLQERMATSADNVLTFLRDLIQQARPHAEEEAQALRQFAADHLGITTLQAWDVAYACEKMREATFDFSDSEVRAHLQLDNVMRGLFACIKQLFGVTFQTQPAATWHDSVRHYVLLSADSKPLGYLYVDLYTRPTKRGGAWMSGALTRCYRDNQLQLPIAHIVCNFSAPVADKSILLNWDEALTLFHECGHALHHLLTQVDDYHASGINGVEWDAVELPSQWLENFLWDFRILAPMSRHLSDGKTLPPALFEKMQAARCFQSGLWLLRQLEFALFDFLLHHGNENVPPMTLLAQVRKDTAVLPIPDYNRFPCAFSHIFGGSYAAGYYGYLWAQMLAADAFTLFKQAPHAADATLGQHFWQQILAVGGSRSMMDSFIALCGREPAIEPLLSHYGLRP